MPLDKSIKIVFIVPTLFAGGSERIVSFLAQNIDKTKFDATLIVIGLKAESAYEVTNINVEFLEKSRVLNAILPLYKYLKNNKPDIVLSVIGHLNTVMAYLSIFFPKTKFIARESTVLSVDAELSKGKNSSVIFNFLADNRFWFFDKIICQSADMLDDIKRFNGVVTEKLIVINNPITYDFVVKDNLQKNECLKLITVARLSKEKGVLRILEILSKLNRPFHFTLIGDGPEKETIMSVVKTYHLQDKFTYIPFTKNVEIYLSANDYFLQGSYVEGFPNAVLESCVVGTPVIAFNVPGGTKEIITEGINGYLVNNEDEFLEKLQNNKEWNSKEISISVYEKFNKEKVLQQYEALFLDILKPI